VSSISGLTGPKTATPLLHDPVLPIPKKFALQFIDVRESSSVRFLLQNTPNTIPVVNCMDLGRVSSVATNQACVEQIIVPYLSTILLNCFRKRLKLSNSHGKVVA